MQINDLLSHRGTMANFPKGERFFADGTRQPLMDPPNQTQQMWRALVRFQPFGASLSGVMVRAMIDNVRRLGFRQLLAPVRPSSKHLEPDVPMAELHARRSASVVDMTAASTAATASPRTNGENSLSMTLRKI